MSEPIPESIPTSADPRSKRATKKRALTPVSQQSAQVDALFAHPDRPVPIPNPVKSRTLAPPPEVVANVQGSSAGAGSGEFHVYKAARRKEYERLRLMDSETKREEADKQFEKKREELRRADEEKTRRNKAKRERQRARKDKAKTKGRVGDDGGDGSDGRTGVQQRANGKHEGRNGGLNGEDGSRKDEVSGRQGATRSEGAVKSSLDGGEDEAVESIGIVIHDDG